MTSHHTSPPQATQIATTSLAQASASLVSSNNTANFIPARPSHVSQPPQHASSYNAVFYDPRDDIISYGHAEGNVKGLASTKAGKWVNTNISSTARIQQRVSGLSDDLHIKHWRRADYGTEYRWSKFDKRLKQLQYDATEYDTLLCDVDWTRNETDELMQLCTQYDCRWFVVFDRWQMVYADMYDKADVIDSIPSINDVKTDDVDGITADPPVHANKAEIDMTGTSANNNLDVVHSTTTVAAAPVTDMLITPATASAGKPTVQKPTKVKTLEELKARYYDIQRRLMQSRNSSDAELYRHTLFYNNFDAPYEVGRKQELLKLYSRDAESVNDIVPYVLEHRKLTTEIKKLKRVAKFERMKQKNAIAAKASNIHKQSQQQKKRKSSVNDDLSIPGSVSLSPNQPLADIPPDCQPAAEMLPSQPPIYLRSSQLNSVALLNPRVSALMDKQLALLNIRKNNQLLINVPTGVVAEMYDRLRNDIVLLDNLNRYANEAERKRDVLAATKKHRTR